MSRTPKYCMNCVYLHDAVEQKLPRRIGNPGPWCTKRSAPANRETHNWCKEQEQKTVMVFAWKNNEKRKQFYRSECRVIRYGKRNSILIEFSNGERLVTSRNAVRKHRITKNTQLELV